MAARMAVVRALSACGRFRVTRAAARSVSMRMSPVPAFPTAASVTEADCDRRLPCRLLSSSPDLTQLPSATYRISGRLHFRVIHDCHVGGKLQFRFALRRGGVEVGSARGTGANRR